MPAAVEIEGTILGIMLNPFPEPKRVVFDLIRSAEVFYKTEHHHIYRAMLHLEHTGSPVDLMTVNEKLRADGLLEAVGGTRALMQMGAAVTSDGAVEAYCRVLLEKQMKRRMIEIGTEAITQGFDESVDCFDAIETTQSAVTGLVTGLEGSAYLDSKVLAANALETLDRMMASDGRLTGVPSGYAQLDALSNGWQPGHLIIVAARPSVGKTAFALQLGLNASLSGNGIGFFSLEMSEKEIMERELSSLSGIYLDNISKGRLHQGQLANVRQAAEHFTKLNFCVDDSAGLDLYSMRSKARRMVQKNGVRMLMVDYLQLMTASLSNQRNAIREQEIASISRGLKSLAKELNVPIIALSQMSRGIESRTDKRPQLSDLRESGAIEQDANIIMFLSREDYQMNPEEQAQLPDHKKHEVRVDIRKNRGGPLDEILMYFTKDNQRWYDVLGYDQMNGKAPFGNSNATMQGAFQRKTAADFEP